MRPAPCACSITCGILVSVLKLTYQVSVPTPDGMIQLKIPAGIHNGQKMRLKDKGLKRKNGTLGDMFVRVKIDTPLEQSTEEIELYQKIFELRNR